MKNLSFLMILLLSGSIYSSEHSSKGLPDNPVSSGIFKEYDLAESAGNFTSEQVAVAEQDGTCNPSGFQHQTIVVGRHAVHLPTARRNVEEACKEQVVKFTLSAATKLVTGSTNPLLSAAMTALLSSVVPVPAPATPTTPTASIPARITSAPATPPTVNR